MKKVVIVIIGLLAIFSIIRASAEEQNSRLNIHPGTIEFADDDSGITVGFGLIESSGDKNPVWNIFPVKISLHNGKQKMYLAMNGFSFLTANGVNFVDPVLITGTHQGDVISFGGDITIRGRVQGNVWGFGADVSLASGSEVVGDVVSLGGVVNSEGRASIRGNKYSLPELKIPFLNLLSADNGIQTIRFYIELFQMALFLLLLFLLLFFREDAVKNQSDSLFRHWKGSLVFLLASFIVLPLLIFFLVTSVYGILFLPVLLLFLIILAAVGFMTVSIRVGKILLRQDSDSMGHFYLCGLVGMLMLKGPAILGILLTMLSSGLIVAVGNFLSGLSAVAIALAFCYGYGVSLVNLRSGG